MELKNPKTIFHFLRPRLVHPVIVAVLIFCFSGMSALTLPCSAICAGTASETTTNDARDLASSNLDSPDLDSTDADREGLTEFGQEAGETIASESCCDGMSGAMSQTMSCCVAPARAQDMLATSISNVDLRTFSVILPIPAFWNQSSEANRASFIEASLAKRSKPPTAASAKIYIINRSLLI